MDISITKKPKLAGESEKSYRVRLFAWRCSLEDESKSDREIYIKAAEKFSQTPEYVWSQRNNIRLKFEIDNSIWDWHRQVRFYTDLNETEYTDYCLKFFKHLEDWK